MKLNQNGLQRKNAEVEKTYKRKIQNPSSNTYKSRIEIEANYDQSRNYYSEQESNLHLTIESYALPSSPRDARRKFKGSTRRKLQEENPKTEAPYKKRKKYKRKKRPTKRNIPTEKKPTKKFQINF